ncbi:RNase HII [Thiohalomonas denitrificans]|uniref:Ribonuclease HII n=1 Tax=Thiohalomonas denitrificans TaxID=415747 RepID=A0A1G5Q303_9GAMM|nr:RNase HII [Thiohalomonas denitrificans]
MPIQTRFDFSTGSDRIAGVDEAGRGPLAGAVIAAAVILDPNHPVEGLDDSKVLSAATREALYEAITGSASAWAVGRAEVEEIDRINILQATLKAMTRAVNGLGVEPEHVLVDGNQCPQVPYPVQYVIGGDALVPAISAASIVAKVIRDREMAQLDTRFPGYGFASHKGYSTAAHLDALNRLGPSPVHRTSFAPVRRLLEREFG